MFLSEAAAQQQLRAKLSSVPQTPLAQFASSSGPSWNDSASFGVFAVLKHNVYYFIVCLLVLVLVGHVTRSGACDWLAAPLSLSAVLSWPANGAGCGPVRF